MKSKLTLISVIIGILIVSQSAWALQIVSPKEGDIVYAGDNLTIIAKPDPGENWIGVAFGFDAMTYNAATDEYKITIKVPEDYYGYYDNLIITAADSDGNSIELRGKIFVKTPSDVVLKAIEVERSLIVLKSYPPDSNPEDIENFGKRKLHVFGIYSDGINRELSSSAKGTTYTSSDVAVATVDTEGIVIAQGLGRAKITITNGEYSTIVDVIVKQ